MQPIKEMMATGNREVEGHTKDGCDQAWVICEAGDAHDKQSTSMATYHYANNVVLESRQFDEWHKHTEVAG